jgi:CubicO group peptidase (beta-lactamase class C family)
MGALGRRTFIGGLLGFVVGCGRTPEAADRPDGRWQNIDAYLKQQFSGTVLVERGGQPLFRHGYGLADRQRNLPNTEWTVFDIASMGKMFTAVAIAQLVERRLLSFTDTASRYVRGLPSTITVHHLLTHTSGLGDEALRGAPGSEPPQTIAGMLQRIVGQQLQFKPGTQFAYSNDGFIVLGAIIERITRRPYTDHVRAHVLQRAAMTGTEIRIYKPADVPGMAHGYLPEGQDTATITEIGNPSGGAYSTAGDLLSFGRALLGHQLLSATMTETMLAGKVDTPRASGSAHDRYGYGFADQRINDVRIVGHNGGAPGYEGQLDIYPERGYIVVALSNAERGAMAAIRRTHDILTR